MKYVIIKYLKYLNILEFINYYHYSLSSKTLNIYSYVHLKNYKKIIREIFFANGQRFKILKLQDI